jgi:hypothetical protein
LSLVDIGGAALVILENDNGFIPNVGTKGLAKHETSDSPFSDHDCAAVGFVPMGYPEPIQRGGGKDYAQRFVNCVIFAPLNLDALSWFLTI